MLFVFQILVMRTILLFAISLLQLTFSGICYAQEEKETFNQLLIDDSADMSTIAGYSETVRHSVFEACTQPQGIAGMNDLQKNSGQHFRSLLSAYSKEEQQKIWNLTRYPGLINKLMSTGPLSKQALEDVLIFYPKEIHDDAMNYTVNHFYIIKNINRINEEFDQAFEATIRTYSTSVQNAFRELLKTPELISLLNNNMHMAVHLGAIYQKNPEYLIQQFNAMNLEQAEQKARDLEEWKQKMKEDPEAERELQQSAKEYAQEYGYSQNDYYETDPVYINRYVFVPYPYWCGYPSWYDYEWWYPYPYWYHWGFSYWHGSIYWHSAPSWYFVHWHFRHHPHFDHYPHITNVYINYYHGHHRLNVRGPEVVHRWVEENRRVLPKDFISNEKNRIPVIKDYGKFANDFDRENKSAPVKMEQNDFLKKNAAKYPALKPDFQEQPKQIGNEKWNQVTPEREEPVFKPAPDKPVEKQKVEPINKQTEKYYEPNIPQKQLEQPKQYQPIPKQEEKRWEQPKQQPYQPKPNIQQEPRVQPRQNVQPVQPQQNFQPKQNLQLKPNYQPVPRQNVPAPQRSQPGKIGIQKK